MASKMLEQKLKSVLAMLNANYEANQYSASAVKGLARSEFINNFLKSSVPQGLRISTSGEIIDSYNNQTGELDIVLENGYFPNIPTLNTDSSRLFFAEGVAAVVEVKSNLQGQWNEAVDTGRKLQSIRREFGSTSVSAHGVSNLMILDVTVNDPTLPKIPMPPEMMMLKKTPYFVVGYKGWNTNKTLLEKLRENEDVITGVLQLDRGVFYTNDSFSGISATGPLCLLGFLHAIYQSYSFIKSTNANLLNYGMSRQV
ncbi:hypothetical protein GKQ23_15725 [Erwinia sp. E602]|uniref:DUF6602 domain-containing protein n=1 Tax=Erwinia sp. E602 TaxID=2675378 RepID=UPI001BAD6097|nr:DUF6602 domain-containing protein [Erwinia sp. E602]QUG76361.1 hypothetical protein GKQ23_15725 [Erwinia sp. E602]